ncbi:MAG: hypothetical protein HOV78_11680 [Hamadaea sp.]|nr:hypothetical protein [Hamadaea sp.]
MPIIFDGAVEPDDLTTYVRGIPMPSELTLLNTMPTRHLQTNTVNFAEIVRTNRTARFRSFDGRVHVSKRDAGSEKNVSLLPLSSSLQMGEYERLQLEFARLHGGNQAALADAAYNDADILTAQVRNRLEQAWGQVYGTGKLTIAENGFAGEADFGVPANHKVAPSTAWTDTTNAKVLTDIQSWSDTYRATNGFAPGRMKTSLRMLRLAQRNAEVINAVYGAAQGRTRVSITELNDLLLSEGLPTFDDPYETRLDIDDVATRTVGDGVVVFLPSDLTQLGYTAFGVSATALELVNSGKVDLSFENASGIVGVVYKEDGVPFREYTYVDCTAMPILSNARRLMIAQAAPDVEAAA